MTCRKVVFLLFTVEAHLSQLGPEPSPTDRRSKHQNLSLSVLEAEVPDLGPMSLVPPRPPQPDPPALAGRASASCTQALRQTCAPGQSGVRAVARLAQGGSQQRAQGPAGVTLPHPRPSLGWWPRLRPQVLPGSERCLQGLVGRVGQSRARARPLRPG